MSYIVKDFSMCQYNPLVRGDLYKFYPDLRTRPSFLVKSFAVGSDKGKVIRWIFSLYQPESPLVRDFSDYRVRRIRAADIFGFERGGDGSFVDVYSDILSGKNLKVNAAILEFCRMLRDDDYSELRIYQDKLYELLGRLQELNIGKDEKIILDNISILKDRIGVLRKKFVLGDENTGLESSLEVSLDNDYVDMSRESIARSLQEGIDIYGESFVPPYGADFIKQYSIDVNRERFMSSHLSKQ